MMKTRLIKCGLFLVLTQLVIPQMVLAVDVPVKTGVGHGSCFKFTLPEAVKG
jgi:hypothetical protein